MIKKHSPSLEMKGTVDNLLLKAANFLLIVAMLHLSLLPNPLRYL